MQDSDKSQQQAGPAGAAPVAGAVQIARRKAILKGLGKAAAVTGAAMPLSSLATTRMRLKKSDGKYYHCSCSGNMSVMMSAGTPVPPTCSGKRPVHYKSNDGQCVNKHRWNWTKWPYSNNDACVRTAASGGILRYPTDTFRTVFGDGSSTMIGQLCISGGTSDEAHWVAALLNANQYASTFPYKPEEVLDHYKKQRSVAIAFYKLVNTG